MKRKVILKKWQLTRWRGRDELADLTAENFFSIGKRSFYKNRMIRKVLLPKGVSVLKAEAFSGCVNLESVVLPTERAIGVSRGTFHNCTSLNELQNADMISSIGDYAFENCRVLSDYGGGKNLCRIGKYAFRNCEAIEAVTLPFSMRMLGKGAFLGCTRLENVMMQDGFSMLSKDVFRGCTSLKQVTFCNTLKEIPNGAFCSCRSLEGITVPSQVKRIGSRAFFGCAGLQTVTVEQGVRSIGAFAFAKNNCLESVYIPRSVKKIGFGAFGLGRRDAKIKLLVDTEYMKKRLDRQLRACMSAGSAEVVVIGKSIDERKRERRRATVEQTPAHLLD